jgi:NAD+ synthase
MKSEVYAMAAEAGVISSILEAKPTDDLWEGGTTDEQQIGATYDELEVAMETFELLGKKKFEGSASDN